MLPRRSSPEARSRTFSAAEKYRRALANAERHLSRMASRHQDTKARLELADDSEREEAAKREWLARVEWHDAEAYVAACRQKLGEEERRLMRPDTFLRFT